MKTTAQKLGELMKKSSFAFFCLVFPLKVALPGHLAFLCLLPPELSSSSCNPAGGVAFL